MKTFSNSRPHHALGVAVALLCCGFTASVGVTASVARAAPLSFSDVNGKKHALADKTKRATVLLFVARDCPISNTYAPEVNRIVKQYAKDARFFLVYPDSKISAQQARAHAKDFGYQMPLVVDAKHQLARAVGATVTPQVAVLNGEGKRLYLGRINNLYVGFGKKRARITQHDLRDSLDAILAGKSVPHATTTAIGCFIPENN